MLLLLLPCAFRVHEDNRHLLLSRPVLSAAGLQHFAAQSRLRVRDAPVLQSPHRPGVAEVRLSEDSGGETTAWSRFMLGARHTETMGHCGVTQCLKMEFFHLLFFFSLCFGLHQAGFLYSSAVFSVLNPKSQ